jgi:hypothetical protein
MNTSALALAALVVVTAPAATSFAQHPAMPAGMTHEQHLAQIAKDRALNERGAAAMGFDQDSTTHHFHLLSDGGAIEVVANDPSDTPSRDHIRTHLKEIAAEFARGDFAKPLMTHGEVPPGVRTLRAHKETLRFAYEDRPNGGVVRIMTRDARTRDAVHAFLRYQIREHATGDPGAVAK